MQRWVVNVQVVADVVVDVGFAVDVDDEFGCEWESGGECGHGRGCGVVVATGYSQAPCVHPCMAPCRYVVSIPLPRGAVLVRDRAPVNCTAAFHRWLCGYSSSSRVTPCRPTRGCCISSGLSPGVYGVQPRPLGSSQAMRQHRRAILASSRHFGMPLPLRSRPCVRPATLKLSFPFYSVQQVLHDTTASGTRGHPLSVLCAGHRRQGDSHSTLQLQGWACRRLGRPRHEALSPPGTHIVGGSRAPSSF